LKITDYPGVNASYKDMWAAVQEGIATHVKLLMDFAHDVSRNDWFTHNDQMNVYVVLLDARSERIAHDRLQSNSQPSRLRFLDRQSNISTIRSLIMFRLDSQLSPILQQRIVRDDR
jgi:hypothetical protein